MKNKICCSGKERGRKNQKKRKEGKGKKEGREGKGEERKERNANKYLMSFQKNTRKKPHWMRNNPKPQINNFSPVFFLMERGSRRRKDHETTLVVCGGEGGGGWCWGARWFSFEIIKKGKEEKEREGIQRRKVEPRDKVGGRSKP